MTTFFAQEFYTWDEFGPINILVSSNYFHCLKLNVYLTIKAKNYKKGTLKINHLQALVCSEQLYIYSILHFFRVIIWILFVYIFLKLLSALL